MNSENVYRPLMGDEEIEAETPRPMPPPAKLSKNRVVSIVQLDGTDQLIVTGPYGHAVCRNDNPVEIGLHVVEVLTGHQLAPATNARK